MTTEEKPKVRLLELRSAEVVLIIMEEFMMMQRPDGMDAADALDDLQERDDSTKLLVNLATDAAERILEYFIGQMEAGGAEPVEHMKISEDDYRRQKQ